MTRLRRLKKRVAKLQANVAHLVAVNLNGIRATPTLDHYRRLLSMAEIDLAAERKRRANK